MKRIIVQNGMFFKKFVQSDSLSICPDLHVICVGVKPTFIFRRMNAVRVTSLSLHGVITKLCRSFSGTTKFSFFCVLLDSELLCEFSSSALDTSILRGSVRDIPANLSTPVHVKAMNR